ncbi:DNA repair protein RadA [Peptoniphilus catoniae]|uniref:DNA repair protein RadA n=1 Tax=Peptoniphilus catoniae TaxID=1660341 RepID=UPI0010FD767A|nr:DNA repair protein RadA [Peptoniphilus catoniae]
MKKETRYKCKECGYISYGYFGRCSSCGAWDSFEELVEVKESTTKKSINKQTSSKKLKNVETGTSYRIKTSIEEFNRVMGGGIVKDSISIITAKPGAGKSTLLLQVANDIASNGKKVLYASGEESESQIKSRANRIEEKISDNIYVYSDNILDNVLEEIDKLDPDLIIIDSIQTFTLAEIQSRAGTPTQVMECAHRLVDIAKDPIRPRIVFLVGQMTKEDELAGVRALEHLVDTVLIIENEGNEELRYLLTSKNRYGSTGEMGFFIMTDKGLKSLDNPSEYFMTYRERGKELPGSTLAVIREGTRPVILEIESLCSHSFLPYPSRISENMKRDQLNTLISILEQRASLKLLDKNVVVKTTGGIRLKETASNLAVIMSIYSAAKDIAIDTATVFIGDVGLTGEIKSVPSLELRLREVQRMGFKRAFIPQVKIDEKSFKDLKLYKCKTILDVIEKIVSS